MNEKINIKLELALAYRHIDLQKSVDLFEEVLIMVSIHDYQN